jgi:hypothetical protein
MIDVNDVAEVAAKVLGEKMHYGATYELCGSETLTPEGIARSIGKALGNTVIAQTQTIDAWKAANHRLGNYQIKVLSKMFLYYDKYGLVGNSNTIENLLGRPPASFEEFLGRELTNKKRPA